MTDAAQEKIQRAGNNDARWWLPEFKDQRHERVQRVVNRIWEAQAYRRELHLRHARLYGNLPILGLGPRSYARRALVGSGSNLALNVCRSCADGYIAKLTKDRPKVSFLTSGGDWSLQQRAEKLEQFVDGQFYESDMYEQAPLFALDSAVFGNAIAKIYADGDGKDERICVERVLPWELLVDDEEAVYGEPKNYYQRKYVDKVVLAAMFPEMGDEIMRAHRSEADVEEWGYDSVSEQVIVTESWHVRSSAKSKDGRHCITIGEHTLLDEEWDKDYAPFIVLRRQKPLVGWWGTGICQELTGIQLELNILLQKIQRSHHLLAAGHWLIENGSKINSNKIDNEIGSMIRFTGTPPQLVVGQAVSPEVYEHLDRLYQRAYELTGISQMSAQSQKPAGLDSGEALRRYADIETDRFQVSYRAYQHFFLQAAERMIDLARDIAERNEDFSVKATSRNVMRQIRWKDVDLREDEYVLKLYPTNALAQDWSSRVAQVQEWANAGWVDKQDALRLLDFPDLQAFSNYENASYELVMSIIERIISDGEYIGPEKEMNLEDAVRRVQLAYLKGKRDKVPDERLELLQRWMSEAQDLLEPPPPPPAANDNGQPAASPMPPAAPPANTNGAPPPAAGAPPPGAMVQ